MAYLKSSAFSTRKLSCFSVCPYCCCLVAQSCPTLCDPMDCSMPGFPVLHHLPEFAQTHVCWVSDTIQPSPPLSSPSLLLSVFPSIKLFSSESALHIRWPKYWSFSFSISPSSEYSGLIPLGLTGLTSLLSKGLSRTFSSTTVWNHQFFGTQPSLWSNFHIHTWLLEKPQLWLYEPLLAKWYLCCLICCLVWS